MLRCSLYSIIICCFFINSSGYFMKKPKCGDLFLTVGALDNTLQLNWDYTKNCNVIPDTLILFYRNSENIAFDLDQISLNSQLIDTYSSQVEFGNLAFSGNWNENDTVPISGSHCYPFWLKSLYKKEIVDTVCIKIEPTWMKSFGELEIRNMMLPGTHDSGALTGNHISIIERYTFTQDMNFWGQLVSGVRYFDIRVGLYKDSNPRLWINHGKVRCSKMEEELNHVANFLRKAPTEIVILHFHSFEIPLNFEDEDHQEVLELLEKVLGEFILQPKIFIHNSNFTLKDMWNLNKRVIVSYNDLYQISRHNWLWHPIPHKWGNKRTADDLYHYLKKVKNDHSHTLLPFCVLIGALTANIEYIIKNPFKSLRHMVDEVNPSLSFWIRNENWADDIEIIATDFFMGNDIIDITIETNFKKLGNFSSLKNN